MAAARRSIKEAEFVNKVNETVNYGMHVEQETNTLWVLRGNNVHKVVMFDKELKAIDRIQFPDIGAAIDLCFLPDNRVAVTDGLNPQIVVYSKDLYGKLSVKHKPLFIMIKEIPNPRGVCRVGEQFLAVNLENGNTVIIDVGLKNEVDFNADIVLTIPKTQDPGCSNGICWTKRDELVIGDFRGNRVLMLEVKWKGREFDYKQLFEVQVDDPGFLSYCQMTDQIIIPSKHAREIIMLSRGEGKQWTKCTLIRNIPSYPQSVAIDESDPQILYVGTPDHLAKYSLHLEDVKQ